MMSRIKLPFILAVVVTTPLAACSDDYLARRHTLSPAAGDAVRMNVATHVIDPWPRNAANTNIVFSGERMVNAVQASQRGPMQKSPGAEAPSGGAR